MDFATIRKTTITALFADDELARMLALKGGNALRLVHGITNRTSVDLDFSIEQDFPDFPRAKERIFHVLKDRFDSAGYVVLDERLLPKPLIEGEDTKPWWGGYQLSFKLIQKERYEQLRHLPKRLSVEALVTGLHNKREFTVDLSKHEYTQGKEEHELDNYTIYVYSPEMIAIEKLRAICQQMPDYPHKGHPKARARDFYDIHATITQREINLTSPENISILHHIFDAKRVPLELLAKVADFREFHRPDWPSVRDSVAARNLEDFDFYFDFVLGEIQKLKALREI